MTTMYLPESLKILSIFLGGTAFGMFLGLLMEEVRIKYRFYIPGFLAFCAIILACIQI